MSFQIFIHITKKKKTPKSKTKILYAINVHIKEKNAYINKREVGNSTVLTVVKVIIIFKQ